MKPICHTYYVSPQKIKMLKNQYICSTIFTNCYIKRTRDQIHVNLYKTYNINEKILCINDLKNTTFTIL